jgi:hypothetical protein
MKIPELYVREVVWAISGLDYQVSKIAKTYSRRMKVFHAKYAFFFFSRTRRDDLSRAMLSESMAVLEVIQGMKELKEKFLESTGVNEDMSLITFAEMIEQGINES